MDNIPVPGSIPSQEEIAFEVKVWSRHVINKFHRGCAPEECDFNLESFVSEVQLGALKRLKRFRHGGKMKLSEYTYMACYQSMRDVQRRALQRANRAGSSNTFVAYMGRAKRVKKKAPK
jgi:hypothetical protein